MMSGLIGKIRKYKYVSFDVFDTLVERSVTLPTDIFKLTGDAVLGPDNDFEVKRIEAEHKARELKPSREVNLTEIYDQLKAEYGDQTDKLMVEEIAQEIKSCSLKPSMSEAYNESVSHCEKVFIISDMYLPSSVIEEILEKNGIKGYSKIYVSNEYECNKLTGELYKYVLKDNGIRESEIMHIGDSIKADLLGAKKAGIKGCLIGRKNRLKRFINRK